MTSPYAPRPDKPALYLNPPAGKKLGHDGKTLTLVDIPPAQADAPARAAAAAPADAPDALLGSLSDKNRHADSRMQAFTTWSGERFHLLLAVLQGPWRKQP